MSRVTDGARVPTENIHASTVASQGRAVLITGPSGSGKSDLALRLVDRGFTLVSDDRTIVRREGERLIGSAPPEIAGKLEVRGVGIVDMESTGDIPIALLIQLTNEVQRLPDGNREQAILGVKIPLVSIDPMSASAASKVALALDFLGLKF